jgi:hypothetical protein
MVREMSLQGRRCTARKTDMDNHSSHYLTFVLTFAMDATFQQGKRPFQSGAAGVHRI